MTTLALDFLTSLEQREVRLLGWGYVDGSWSRDELIDLADEFVIANDKTGLVTPAQVIEELRSRALLLAVDGGAGKTFRTRMAETVRLLSRLRQLFPKHRDAGWIHAPTLVSDFRVVARARTYPDRNVPAEEVIAAAVAACAEGRPIAAPLRALLGGDKLMDLARFQSDATADIVRGLSSGRSGGTIVGAGTGSGKTLAFYLPALSHLASSPDEGTRVLAIYPRIELLRDQFAEAMRTARALDGVGSLGRPIRLAPLYGSTPFSAAGVDRLWAPRGADRICPYLLCPTCEKGALLWRRGDLERAVPTLHCERCETPLGEDRIVLTRDRMRALPPDLLFTTTEMLNRTLMDGRMRHLVGVGRGSMPIDLVLLDEVHTYEGTTGAQVAGVLRRWRHARRRPVHFVGLSATLREAGAFFADLTGLPPQSVTSIEPRPRDLKHEGQEYLLAMRADPHSGASVLSTSIQASMLMQRALDPLDDARSGGIFGQRLFAFTDDLDVTNRMYFDLLDAEGLDSWGNPTKPSLAALRGPTGGDLAARRTAGQLWDALEATGHRFDDAAHTQIGRTTSQDADVDRDANAIVATASLEVGFNDPRVGAVLQHKSPHGAAAFLQRKGRAGRDRAMRPWTLIVLSDFGRDRVTYQSYERLFDPELTPRSLPIANPAVVRMQAVFATMDWLSTRLRGNAQVWRLLQGPPASGSYREHNRRQQLELADEIERVLTDANVRDALALHLKRALACSEAVVEEIFWLPPRPLLTTVLPTALRRLKSSWHDLELGDERDYVADGPLPEFVVSRLFADLALPEITVITPAQTRNEDERREQLRAVQALNTYAPGRVSHRLTVSQRFARHWLAPPDDGSERMSIRAVATDFEEIGVFGRGTADEARVVRPLTMRVQVPGADVLSSSHGRLEWRTEIVPVRDSEQVLRPAGNSPLSDIVEAVRFFTHGALAQVETRRWAAGARFEIHGHGSGTRRGSVRFADSERDDADVAIGLAVDVDAVAVDVRLPPAVLSGRALHDAHVRGLRTELFGHRMRGAGRSQGLGDFNIDRLAESAVLVLARAALERDSSLEAVYADLRASRLVDELAAEVRGLGDHPGATPAGLAELIEALDNGSALDLLDDLVPTLWEAPDQRWDAWGEERLATTVGAAVHAALQELCPEYDGDDVVVDVEAARSVSTTVRVWLSEQTIGGGGLIQEALRRIGDGPRVFFELIVAGIEPSIDEAVDAEMTRIAGLALADDRVAAALADVREASDQGSRTTAFDDLLEVLGTSGVFVCHPVLSALSVRALRPGADGRTDATIAMLVDDWDQVTQVLGIDLDLRAYSDLRSSDTRFDDRSGLAAPAENARAWRAGQITGLLWQRGATLRADAMRAPNTFHDLPPSDPTLLRSLLHAGPDPVEAEDIESALAGDSLLARDGEVTVQSSVAEARALREAIIRAACTPIESGPLFHYPRAVGVRREGQRLRARIVLDLVGE